MFSFFGKVKVWAIAALSAALPIVYFFGHLIGKNKGRSVEQLDRLEDSNETNRQVADFYKSMADDEEITHGNFDKRDNLTDRLRDKGL
jgi:hypothetical protein